MSIPHPDPIGHVDREKRLSTLSASALLTIIRSRFTPECINEDEWDALALKVRELERIQRESRHPYEKSY